MSNDLIKKNDDIDRTNFEVVLDPTRSKKMGGMIKTIYREKQKEVGIVDVTPEKQFKKPIIISPASYTINLKPEDNISEKALKELEDFVAEFNEYHQKLIEETKDE